MTKKLKGKFIVFEGGEGSEKTTQIKLLKQNLEKCGIQVFLTREPGGTDCPIAEKIRHLLKDPANKNMCAKTEFFLFLASRAQHVKQTIVPHLQKDHAVICDRFYGSTLAYQHFGRGLFALPEMKKINSLATGGLEPDLTILLDMQSEKGLNRINARRSQDRLDSEKAEFHQKVRQGFLNLAESLPNWQIIQADDTIENINKKIWQKIKPLI